MIRENWRLRDAPQRPVASKGASMFIRVFGHTYLNPDAVGKFETDVSGEM
jgi:hypothetical protein